MFSWKTVIKADIHLPLHAKRHSRHSKLKHGNVIAEACRKCFSKRCESLRVTALQCIIFTEVYVPNGLGTAFPIISSFAEEKGKETNVRLHLTDELWSSVTLAFLDRK